MERVGATGFSVGSGRWAVVRSGGLCVEDCIERSPLCLGDTIQLKQPNGVFNVTVPAGVRPGGVFHLHLPAAVLGTPSGSDDASQPVANAQPAASASASESPSSC